MKNTIVIHGKLVGERTSSTGKYFVFETKRPKSHNIDTIYVAVTDLLTSAKSKFMRIHGYLKKSAEKGLEDFVFIVPTAADKITEEAYNITWTEYDPIDFVPSFLKNNKFSITGKVIPDDENKDIILLNTNATTEVKSRHLIEVKFEGTDGFIYNVVVWGRLTTKFRQLTTCECVCLTGRLTSRLIEGKLVYSLTAQRIRECIKK